MPDLDAKGIAKSFGGVRALDGVDFAADAGEVHALLGENGAGKSTFIKILTGAVAPDAGTISLFGEALSHSSPRAASRAGVSAVFQELSLVPDLTVAQNIWFRREPLTVLGTVPGRELVRATERLFRRLEFPPVDPRREVRGLSSPSGSSSRSRRPSRRSRAYWSSTRRRRRSRRARSTGC